MKNPNCDNDKCLKENGEVRVLPIGGSSNAILCKTCFWHEIAFRKERNKELGNAFQFDIPKWEDLKVYGETEYKTYKIYTYDVWGNAEDGYEVNNMFESSFIIMLKPDCSDQEIKEALIETGFCNDEILKEKIDTDGDDTIIYINLSDGEPFCELREVGTW